MIRTRQEKEKLILDLYNQGYNYKQIAKIARVSVREINPVLVKAEKEKEKNLAYRLFSEGKTPLDVAIELNLEVPEATRYYREYWNLRHLYSLNMVYEEIGDDNIIHLLKVHKKIKEAGMGVDQAVALIKNANNDLQTLEEEYQKLKGSVYSLESRKLEADRTLNDLHDQIDRAEKMRKWLETERQEKEDNIDQLESEKIRLEQLVKQFKHNDKEYLKIERKIQSKVINLLSDGRGVLKVAVDSLMKSMRKDPQKYINLIYYNQNSSASRYTEHIYVNGQPYPSSDYFREVYKSILLEDAEKLFGVIRRNRELCKPYIRLFYGSAAQKEIEETFQIFLDAKNSKKAASIEATLIPVIIDMVNQKGREVASSEIWDFIKEQLQGESYGSDEYHISDHILYRNTITKLLEDKFGAEPKHTNKRNKVIFNPEKLRRIQRSYDIEIKIKTTLKGEGSEGCEGYVGSATPSNRTKTTDVFDNGNSKDEEFTRNGGSEAYPIPLAGTREPSLPSHPSPIPIETEMSDEEEAAMIERYNRLSAQSRRNWNAATHAKEGDGNVNDHTAKPPSGVVG